MSPPSLPLVHPLGNVLHIIINLARHSPHDKLANCVPSHPDVSVAPQYMNVLIGQYDPRPRRVLDREPSLAVLPCDATDGAGEVVTLQHLHVSNLEGVEVEIVQA